jgi:hypothetical protein
VKTRSGRGPNEEPRAERPPPVCSTLGRSSEHGQNRLPLW